MRLPNAVSQSLHWGLLLSVTSVFLIVGCEGDYRPRALGKEGEVTVVMDSSLWTGAVGEAFRNNITPWVETLPVTERYFDLLHLELRTERVYDRIQKMKNVVIVAPLSDSTNEANFLRRRLTDEAEQAVMDGQSAVVAKPNLWRRSQRVYFVTAATQESLEEALQNQGSEIQNTFKDVTLQRMRRQLYEDGRNRALEDSLRKKHGFTLNLQPDFQLAIDTTTATSGFVWLRRLLTQTRREFFVYYEEGMSPNEITPEWIYATRDSLTRRHLRGNVQGFVRIDYRRPLNTHQITFLDRYGFQSRGLWIMATPTDEGGFRPVGGGGPFLTYTFYDRATDRVYMLDGSIFAPDFDKLEFLRHMEVLAKTFQTAEEARSAKGAGGAAE